MKSALKAIVNLILVWILICAMIAALTIFAAGVYHLTYTTYLDTSNSLLALIIGIFMLSWAWILQRKLIYPRDIEAGVGVRHIAGTVAGCAGFFLIAETLFFGASPALAICGFFLILAGTSPTGIAKRSSIEEFVEIALKAMMDLILVCAMIAALTIFAAGVYHLTHTTTYLDTSNSLVALIIGIFMLSWACILQRKLVHPKDKEAEVSVRQIAGTVAGCVGCFLIVKTFFFGTSPAFAIFGFVLMLAGTSITGITKISRESSSSLSNPNSDKSGKQTDSPSENNDIKKSRKKRSCIVVGCVSLLVFTGGFIFFMIIVFALVLAGDSAIRQGKTDTQYLAGRGHLWQLKIVLFLAPGEVDEVYPAIVKADRPLTLAIRNGHTEVVEFLLKKGASLDDRCRGGSCLEMAVVCGHRDIVEMLLEKGVDIKGDNKALQSAVWVGRDDLAVFLLDHGAEHDELTLSGMGELEEVKKLVAEGKGIASEMMFWAAKNGHADVVEYLIQNGADVNINSNELYKKCYLLSKASMLYYRRTYTALHHAAENGHAETVRLLIRAGADPSKKTKFGRTPLDFATKNGHSETVRVLIKEGANHDIEDRNGNTP